jgi:hypothetical protein
MVATGGSRQKSGKMLLLAFGTQGQHSARGAAAHTGIGTEKEGEKTVGKKAQFLHYAVEHSLFMVWFAA